MRSAEEWYHELLSNEHKRLIPSPIGLFERVQADAYEAGKSAGLETAAGLCDREAKSAGPLGSMAESVGEALAAGLAKRIRALKPKAAP